MLRKPFSRFRELSIITKLLLLIAIFLFISTLVIANSIISSRLEMQPHAVGVSPTASHTVGVNPTSIYTTGISPLLFGANLDNHISSTPQAQAQAKQLGLQTIRLGDTSDAKRLSEFYGRAQIIKDMGLVPLIILHGGGIADPGQRLTIDIEMVNKIQEIFGGKDVKVYYELGNENDLNPGMDANAYTAMWNTILPVIKPLAPQSWFGGPVNYQQNPTYISYFVHNAQPQPNFISWHEYTCGREAPASDCLKHIDNWTTHVNNTRQAITANSDPVPPIMITEWNYSPSGIAGDGKSSDPLFLQQWTTKALQTLAANKVFASYHFDVEEALGLVGDNNNPTVQGRVFHTVCTELLGNGANSTVKCS